MSFQHTAARRRLASHARMCEAFTGFQHTAARRRLGRSIIPISRFHCFNTQPPEGGWESNGSKKADSDGFNTQPPEGGWLTVQESLERNERFNTQPPEGGCGGFFNQHPACCVSTHSRPKAAGQRYCLHIALRHVSTHSRPKAAGASLKSLAPSGFAAPISLSSQEKREREYNTALSVTPAFAIS